MQKEIKAIDTEYKGYLFRSRLEARWAVFFDALGLKWEYEPEGFDLGDGTYYLPDFKVEYPGYETDENHYKWFEVKSDLDRLTADEWKKVLKFDELEGITILDGTPEAKMYNKARQTLVFKDLEGIDRAIAKDNARADKILELMKTHQWFTNKEDGRRGYALWSYEYNNMWLGEDYEFFNNPNSPSAKKIINAVNAAKSARFEHNYRKAA